MFTAINTTRSRGPINPHPKQIFVSLCGSSNYPYKKHWKYGFIVMKIGSKYTEIRIVIFELSLYF